MMVAFEGRRRQDQVLRRAARHSDAKPDEFLDRLDLPAFRSDQDRRIGAVRNRVPHLLRALGRDPEQRDDHVDPVAQEERDAIGRRDRHELDRNAGPRRAGATSGS
jgi:hypothetical protein